MEDHLAYLKEEIAAAQAKYEDNANRYREPTPVIKIGNEVWLNARNIRTKRPLRKLDWKNLGRFKVKRKLNAWAYELELPNTIQIHPVFHISLLTPYATDPLLRQTQPPAQPIEVDGDVSWEIKEIYDSKHTREG